MFLTPPLPRQRTTSLRRRSNGKSTAVETLWGWRGRRAATAVPWNTAVAVYSALPDATCSIFPRPSPATHWDDSTVLAVLPSSRAGEISADEFVLNGPNVMSFDQTVLHTSFMINAVYSRLTNHLKECFLYVCVCVCVSDRVCLCFSAASQSGKLQQSYGDFQPDYFSLTEKPPEEFCLSPDASTSSSSCSSSQSHISVDLTQKRGEAP